MPNAFQIIFDTQKAHFYTDATKTYGVAHRPARQHGAHVARSSGSVLHDALSCANTKAMLMGNPRREPRRLGQIVCG